MEQPTEYRIWYFDEKMDAPKPGDWWKITPNTTDGHITLAFEAGDFWDIETQ